MENRVEVLDWQMFIEECATDAYEALGAEAIEFRHPTAEQIETLASEMLGRLGAGVVLDRGDYGRSPHIIVGSGLEFLADAGSDVLADAMAPVIAPEALLALRRKRHQEAGEFLRYIAYENNYALGKLDHSVGAMDAFNQGYDALTASVESITIPRGFVAEVLAGDLEGTPGLARRRVRRLNQFMESLDALLVEVDSDVDRRPSSYSLNELSRDELIRDYLVRQIVAPWVNDSYDALVGVHERLLRLQYVEQTYSWREDSLLTSENAVSRLLEMARTLPDAEKYLQAIAEESVAIESAIDGDGNLRLGSTIDALNEVVDRLSKAVQHADMLRKAKAFADRTIADDSDMPPSFETIVAILEASFDGRTLTGAEFVASLWVGLRDCSSEAISGLVQYYWDSTPCGSESRRLKLPRRPLKDFLINSVRKIAAQLEERPGLTEAQIVAIRRMPVMFEAIGLVCWEDLVGEAEEKKSRRPTLDDGDDSDDSWEGFSDLGMAGAGGNMLRERVDTDLVVRRKQLSRLSIGD